MASLSPSEAFDLHGMLLDYRVDLRSAPQPPEAELEEIRAMLSLVAEGLHATAGTRGFHGGEALRELSLSPSQRLIVHRALELRSSKAESETGVHQGSMDRYRTML